MNEEAKEEAKKQNLRFGLANIIIKFTDRPLSIALRCSDIILEYLKNEKTTL